MTNMRRSGFIGLIVSILALAACHPAAAPAPQPPLAGARIGGAFALTDQDGHPFSDRHLAGRWRIMYFGYTHCPDVCPIDMQNVGGALRLLDRTDPAVSAKVMPVFVTVDPARDTPPVLKQFVGAFYSRMIGLTGTSDAIARIAKEYGVFYQKAPETQGGDYLMSHSRQAYLMDPAGRPIALLPSDQSPQAVADEIRKWVS